MAIGCAESKKTISTSMPCSAKKPFSLPMKLGLPPIERTTPAFTLSAARLGIAAASARLDPKSSAVSMRLCFITISLPQPRVIGSAARRTVCR
jgi:hypothetical protein